MATDMPITPVMCKRGNILMGINTKEYNMHCKPVKLVLREVVQVCLEQLGLEIVANWIGLLVKLLNVLVAFNFGRTGFTQHRDHRSSCRTSDD